ncbi:MAG: hypothetical protein GY713_07155, partial [Actinomycetia bacterium]|nr:hypothetical protein [Actinomycetes bacterium]
GSPLTPITVTDGLIDMPDLWLMRCGAPPGSGVEGFDDQREDSLADVNGRSAPDPYSLGEVVVPPHGTLSAPYGAAAELERSGSTPRVVSFTGSLEQRFTYLGLHVGLAEPTDEPVQVQLRVRRSGAGGDVDTVTLGPEPGPATTCLLVIAEEGTEFFEANLRLLSEHDDPVQLVIDDVFWSFDTPYPLDPEPDFAEVEILWPTDGLRLSTARPTSVIGRVTVESGVGINATRVASPSWDGAREIIRSTRAGSWTDAGDGRVSRFFWVDGVDVASGEFEIHATIEGPSIRGADSVRVTGSGPPAPPQGEYEAIAEESVDVIPWAMEVTQAVDGPLIVQEPESLVADDRSLVEGKRTVVRAYATQQLLDTVDLREGTLEIDAELYGFRDGVMLPHSPLTPDNGSVNLFSHDPGPRSEAATRPFAENTFNFVLPYEWTEEGDVELRLRANPPESEHYVIERPGAGGALNWISQTVTFTDVGRVGVSAVAFEVYYLCDADWLILDWHPCSGLAEGDVVSTISSPDDVRATLRSWWRVLPASGEFPDYITYSTVTIAHWQDRFAIDEPREVTGPATATSWRNWTDAFYDLYCDDDLETPTLRIRAPSMRDFVAMFEPWPSPVPNAGCAPVNATRAFRTAEAGMVAAQEAAHTAGLRHTSLAHGEGTGVVRFAGDHGQVALPSEPAWGFDTNAMAVLRPDFGDHMHDYLSYGGPMWTSVETWELMFQALSRNRTVGEPRGSVVEAPSEGPASDGDSSQAPGGESVLFEGRVNSEGEITMAAPILVPGGRLGPAAGPDVTVRLLNAGGDVLAEAVTGLEPAGTHGSSTAGVFAVELPVVPEAITLRIDVDGQGSLDVTPDSPAPAIESGPVLDGDRIVWQSPSPGPFEVEATNDGGDTWWPLGSSDDTSLALPDAGPVAGPGWTVRVQTTDGVRVASASSDGIDFTAAPPLAMIGVPANGDLMQPSMVHVEASSSGISDDGTTYEWIVDGAVVNEGRVAEVPIFSEGPHTIGLRVSNEAGVAEDSIEVFAGLDSDGDTMIDVWEEASGLDPHVFDDTGDDPDGDLLPTGQEYRLGTEPLMADTDGDGFSDWRESVSAGDPLDANSIPGPLHGIDDGDLLATAPSSSGSVPPWAWALAGGGLVAVAVGGRELILRRRRESPAG